MTPLCVYTRRGCHLCELLIEELLPLVEGRLAVELRDIDSRDDWQTRFNSLVPLVEYDGRTICQYHLDRDAVAGILTQLGK